MRSKSTIPVVLCCGLVVMLLSSTLFAQESKVQKFVIHEDVVKPKKMMKYEKASKAFVETLTKHKVGAEGQFMTMATNDMRYIFISPLENMAQLDKNPFEKMSEALGKEGNAAVWSSWDGMFETHMDYVINLNTDLSYNSGEIMMEGMNFRHLDYYYLYPDKEQEAKAIAKEWKELYTAKNIPHGYRIYTGGMGTEPMIMVTHWAENGEAYHAQRTATNEMLGDSAEELTARMLTLIKKIESVEGWMRPDLSYMPSATMAEN